MSYKRELRTGVRLMVTALVFLAMSCESDGEGGDCLGSTDNLITGCSDGCGTGMTPIGDGCLGSCLFGGDGDGCGTCAGEGCDIMGDCDMGCGDCGDVGPYSYDGDVVDGAIQVHVTSSLFRFIEGELVNILEAVAGDVLTFLGNDTFQVCVPGDIDVTVATLCSSNKNCSTSGSGPNDGCALNLRLSNISITPQAPNRVRVSLRATVPSPTTWSGGCNVNISGHADAGIIARLPQNAVDRNTEIYVGGGDDITLNIGSLNLSLSGGFLGACGLIPINSLKGTIVDMVKDGIGAVTCRGCDNNADCGAGGRCQNGTCRTINNPYGMCQGLQLGVDARVDAGSLLQTFDPGAEGALGARAFLGSYTNTNANGLQLGGRLGGKADPQSLCVPVRPSPVSPGNDCRTGTNCTPLNDLNTSNMIDGEEFHVGAGVAMGGLNQVLWAAYSSGVLCLSVGGDTEGLEMLGTSLFSTFLGSLTPLTYGNDQPLMIQLRPQQAPNVDFLRDEGQGATIVVSIPELELDFYTVVDERYARIFTVKADVSLPLSIKASAGNVEVAIGDLTQAIDPETLEVLNVEMVQPGQVQTLINNLPSLIGALTGVLGDDLIPPIEIPEMAGIQLSFVGPGLTVLEENSQPAALGLFLKMDLDPDGLGEILGQMEPVIADLQIDVRDPADLRADLNARRVAGQSFSYTDLMPTIVAQMDIAGVDVSPSDAEFAYSVNNGPWTFWKRGPELVIDHPVLATEDKFNVRIAARVAGDANSGSTTYAEFDFVNDYTAPAVSLQADGSVVRVTATDAVYDADELLMAYRTNGGAWSARVPLADIDILPQLLEGKVSLDVAVVDPSGNARTVRRSFGESAPTAATTNSQADADGGCSTTQGNGGILAILALLGLVFFRRRGEQDAAVAASPSYLALAVLALLFLGLGVSGCKSKGAGGDCNPACDSASQCIDGMCVGLLCEGPEDCAPGDECIDGECVANLTCNYSEDCPPGHFCEGNRCYPSECTVADDCNITCPEGELPYCDFDDYGDVQAGQCVCDSGIRLGRHGGWLHVLEESVGGQLVTVAYSEQYGDLIVGTMDNDGVIDWTFVDGVPAGPVVRPPSGHRGGVQLAGDIAGRYVSAVIEDVNGTPVLHASYQYRAEGATESALRYARGEKTGSGWDWTFIDVDNQDIAGLYTEIVLVPPADPVTPPVDGEDEATPASTGGIAILYTVRGIVIDPEDGTPLQNHSEFVIAYADTRTPTEGAEFTVGPLDQVQVGLVDDEAGGFEVVPSGIGLFASAVVDPATRTIHVAYYDQVFGNLSYLTAGVVDGQPVHVDPPVIIDGESGGNSTGDVGRWANIQLNPAGGVVIFYEDTGRAELRAARVNGTTVNITVINDGEYFNDSTRTQVQSNRVGGSIAAVPRTDSGFDVYFQDATNGGVRRVEWPNLNAAPTGHAHTVFASEAVLARELTGGNDLPEGTVVPVPDAGALGFYLNVINNDQRQVIASKNIHAVPGVTETVMDVRANIVVSGTDNGDDDENGDGN